MKKLIFCRDGYAVSELIGGLILVLVALVTFSAILMYVFPLPIESDGANVELKGYVDNNGIITLEHMGGNSLENYKIDVKYLNGTLIDSITHTDRSDPWEIGDPPYKIYLLSGGDMVRVTVSSFSDQGDEEIIFDGILWGRGTSELPTPPTESPMLISSLRTDTSDEDLICYNESITPAINARTYIYNWSVNNNPIVDILLPFDTNSSDVAKDYSGNTHDGTIYGASWMEEGVVGGCYAFDGIDDYMEIPYCYSADVIDELTIEAWINTSGSSGTIASFERENYWELALQGGNIVWSTAAGVDSVDTTSVISIDAESWHHIAATYDSSSGESAIYIDGVIDIIEASHAPGDDLGSGDMPLGTIGYGAEVGEETIFSTSFETQEEEDKWSKYGPRTSDWADQGIFDRFASDSLNPHTGSYCIGGAGDMYYWWSRHHAAYNRESIDISGYTDVTVGVWYSYKDTEGSDEFGLYYQDGGDWEPIFEEYDPDRNGQEPWTYVEASIPDEINSLVLQFWWSTSDRFEYLAIDDLTITGLPAAGSNNFSGRMDDFKIYNRALSAEQIYQNYLCTKDGDSDKSVIVSEEIPESSVGDIWKCTVIPNDGWQDDDEIVESNTLQILSCGGGGG